MGSLADQLVKNGFVTAEHAMRVERDKGVQEVLTERERESRREQTLRRELKKLLKGGDRGAIEAQIERLSEEFCDVFDKVATEFSFDVNLGR